MIKSSLISDKPKPAKPIRERTLGRILSELGPDKVKEFQNWLKQPEPERPSYLTSLIQILKKPEAWNLSAEAFWYRLRPTQPFGKKRFDKVTFQIRKLLISFLLKKRNEREVMEEQVAIMEELNTHDLESGFRDFYNKFQKSWRGKTRKSVHEYHLAYRAERALHTQLLLFPTSRQKINIQASIQAFDTYWILQKLILACREETNRQIYGGEPNVFMLKELLIWLDRQNPNSFPDSINLYRKLLGLLQKEAPFSIDKVWKDFEKKFSLLAEDDQTQIYMVLLNLYVKLYLKQGTHVGAHKPLLNALVWGFERDMFLRRKYLSSSIYKNIITLFVLDQNLDQATYFHETYKQDLPPNEKEDVYTYMKGYLLFCNGNWVQAQSYLGKLHFQNPAYQIPSRILMLQSEYEEEFDNENWDFTKGIMRNKIHTLIKYIKEKKDLSTKNKTHYINRLKLMGTFLKIKSKEDVEKLQEILHSKKSLGNVSWLQKKVKDFLEE